MEYLSPPTTPKKQKLFGTSRHEANAAATISPGTPRSRGAGGSSSSSNSPVAGKAGPPLPSPDRFIPNRAHVDFDYCNSMLSPSECAENKREGKVPAMDKFVSASLLGSGYDAGPSGGSSSKRMIEVFENIAEHETVPEQSFKVRERERDSVYYVAMHLLILLHFRISMHIRILKLILKLTAIYVKCIYTCNQINTQPKMDSDCISAPPKRKTRVIPTTPLKILDAPSKYYCINIYSYRIHIGLVY
jgi:hypothetical protein